VFRAEVIVDGDLETSLTLPADCAAVEVEIRRVGAVLLSVDPLISTVAGRLDTHKDREVREALQPLAQLADRTGCTVLGNAHFGKSTGHDPLALMMGSVAFGNVARAVLGFAQDTDTEDGSCVISQVKNNLGRLDLPSLRYRIDETFIDTDEGVTSVGKLVMLGESDRSVQDILRDRGEGSERTERDEAKDLLRELLMNHQVPAKEVQAAAKDAAISWTTIRRAADDLGVHKIHPDIRDPWFWVLDAHQDAQGAQGLEGEHLAHLVSTLGGVGNPLCTVCGKPNLFHPDSIARGVCAGCIKREAAP
jgi:hypothetical protein